MSKVDRGGILYVTTYEYVWRTLIKKKTIFQIYREIQNGAVAKSYMRKGFLIYEEMRKYLVIYEEAVLSVHRMCRYEAGGHKEMSSILAD